VLAGPQSVDTCQCAARSLKYPCLNDRTHHAAGHQRVRQRHVAVRPQNCRACHPETVQVSDSEMNALVFAANASSTSVSFTGLLRRYITAVLLLLLYLLYA